VLSDRAVEILKSSGKRGWVLEPDSKLLLEDAGFEVPRSELTLSEDEAVAAAERLGWPVVAKVVSPQVVHKSDAGGVIVGIDGAGDLKEAFAGFEKLPGFEGTLVEEMLRGIELIVGGKIDGQFGPVVIAGMGGVAVEVYRDTAIRMAPMDEGEVESMLGEIRAGSILRGYRGSAGVNIGKLCKMISDFSRLIVEMADLIESVDLNPVLCTAERCVVADARIILKKFDN
jgi:succinyl-CoA synthetase beta subunit